MHVLQGEFVDTCRAVLAINMQNKTAMIEIDAKDGLKGQYYFLISHSHAMCVNVGCLCTSCCVVSCIFTDYFSLFPF